MPIRIRHVLQCIGVTLLAGSTFGQSTKPVDEGRAEMLVLPMVGSPVSFKQTGERLIRSADGTLSKFLITGKSYRDSAGRVLMTSETRDGSGGVTARTQIMIDPASGYQIVFLDKTKIAARMKIPNAEVGTFAFTRQAGLAGAKATEKDLGTKMLQSAAFHGYSVTQIDSSNPSAVYRTVWWYSAELKIIAALEISGPHEKVITKIEDLRRQEPAPEVFKIPPEYNVIDVQ